MDQKPEWQEDLTKKNILDRFHLSIQEISELGIGWLIICCVLILTNANLANTILREGRIPDVLLIYLSIFGLAFFIHELSHKFVAIKYGARAHFRLSKEILILMLISLIIQFPILATGAVFWWGEASSSTGIRGRVSAVGPLSNMIQAGIFLIVQGFGILLLDTSFSIGILLFTIGQIGVYLNVIVGVFNLLPVGVLDGAKVLEWDSKIWISIIGSLLVIGLFGAGFIPFIGNILYL